MGANEYLRRLNEISKFEDLKAKHYHAKRGRQYYREEPTDKSRELPNKNNENPTVNYIEFGYAHAEMKDAIEKGDIELALRAWKRYDAIGKSDAPYALNGLLKTIENARKSKRLHDESHVVESLGEIRNIFKRYGEKATLKGKLESSVAVASVIGVLGGLFFLSNNITGNVIGNLSVSSSNWIGAVLIIIGLIGAFFYFKRRR